MPPESVVRIESHLLGVDEGVWCPACLLPSGVRVRMVVVSSATLRVIGRWAKTTCRDCGGPIP